MKHRGAALGAPRRCRCDFRLRAVKGIGASSRGAAKQSLQQSALIPRCVFGNLVGGGALLLLSFYFKTGANKFVDLIANLKVALGELLINVVAWISVPNEPCDFYKKLTTSSEIGIASLQECEGGATNARVL